VPRPYPQQRGPAVTIAPRASQRFADQLLRRQIVAAQVAQRDAAAHLAAGGRQQLVQVRLD